MVVTIIIGTKFAENERLFGVQSTYKEDIYTTALPDKESKLYKEKISEAAKLADEIEKDVGVKGSHRFLHLAEERGIEFETELDEEAKYSSVWRGNTSGGAQNNTAAPSGVSQAKYVPPAKRGTLASEKAPASREEDNGTKGKAESHDRTRMKGSKDSIQQNHASSPKKKAQPEAALSPKQDRTSEQEQPKKSPKEEAKKETKGTKAVVSPTTSATLSTAVVPSSPQQNVASAASSSSPAAGSSVSPSSTSTSSSASSQTSVTSPSTASSETAAATSAPAKPAAASSGSAVKSTLKFNPNAKAFQPTAAPFVPSGAGAAATFALRPANTPGDARKPGDSTNKRIHPHEAETFLFGRSLEIHPRKISDMYCKRMSLQMQQEAPESVSDTWPFGGVQYRYLYSNEEQMYYMRPNVPSPQSPTQSHFGVPPPHYATSPPSPGVVASAAPVLKIQGPQPGMHSIPGYPQIRYQPIPSAPAMAPPYVFPNGQQYPPYPPQPVYSQPPPQVLQKRFYMPPGNKQGVPVQQTSPQFASGFPPPGAAVQQTSPNSIIMEQPMGGMHTFQGQYVTSPPMMRYQETPGHHHQSNITQPDLKKGMPPRGMMYEDYRFINQQPPQHHHHQPQHSPQQPLPPQVQPQPQQQEFVEGHPLHPGHHQPLNLQHQHHQHPHAHQQHHHGHQHQHMGQPQNPQLPQGPQSPQQGQSPLPHHQFPHHQQGASSSPLAFPHMQVMYQQ
eukprot:TRINITY_DN3943_c0_g4_i3.p1 TRINITY_DN3943_c0_g4~~TRINITY_DN3943_c0_g4_i3.p1  ORF type:complete len:729 (-),score=214.69 TRINITY_DN3943_c0_g4_i3:416-2602(-)